MRKSLILCLIILIAVFLSGCSGSTDKQKQEPSKSTTANGQQVNQSPPPPTVETMTWNTKDLSIATNGNIARAVKLLNSTTAKKEIASAEPANIAKTPWSYYGKIVQVSGVIGVVEDYPPGSDYSKALGGGPVSEVVIEADDGTIADFIMLGSSGDYNIGDRVTLSGYPVGREEVPNRIGGAFTHLMITGKYAY